MLFSTKIVLAVSVLVTSLATPLTQCAYIDELKGMIAHFATSWSAIEDIIQGLPKQNATVEQYKVSHIRRRLPLYTLIIKRNTDHNIGHEGTCRLRSK